MNSNEALFSHGLYDRPGDCTRNFARRGKGQRVPLEQGPRGYHFHYDNESGLQL